MSALAADRFGEPEVPFCDVALSVLGFQEDGEWVALALETDLRGCGATFEEAVKELREVVLLQIGFAQHKGHPEMIWKAADPVWFQLFAQVRQERLGAMTEGAEPSNAPYQVAGLPIPLPPQDHALDFELDAEAL